MIDKLTLKQIMVSNQRSIAGYAITRRKLPSDDFPRRVLMGVRRAGKSFMLYQKMQEMLVSGHGWDEMLYLSFEDERLEAFSVGDFQSIIDCHNEMYGKRPMLFLDEVQNISGWEKFARRIADNGYSVWITGSNAKMLSAEIMTTLGGRYISSEVYPFSFCEYLDALCVDHNEMSILDSDHRAYIVRLCNEYMQWGGLPESIHLTAKRDYLSSAFQKIYLSDIAMRNGILNINALRLLIKKLAENVCQPKSYNRLANILSSVSGKISMPTVCKYVDHCEAAWLLLRLRNISASFADRESSCKYYFVDNGVLNLFLLEGDTALLENAVALSLFRKYGHDKDNERVFFYNDKVEVDFYVPEDELAIQVSYSITKSSDAFVREVEALRKLPKVLSCKRRIIITFDEPDEIKDEFGSIEVLPFWRWELHG